MRDVRQSKIDDRPLDFGQSVIRSAGRPLGCHQIDQILLHPLRRPRQRVPMRPAGQRRIGQPIEDRRENRIHELILSPSLCNRFKNRNSEVWGKMVERNQSRRNEIAHSQPLNESKVMSLVQGLSGSQLPFFGSGPGRINIFSRHPRSISSNSPLGSGIFRLRACWINSSV
jgi:hypothetical protein